MNLLVECSVIGFHQLDGEDFVTRLGGRLDIGRNRVLMAENLVDSVGISPVCHTRILLAHAEALTGDVANLALGTLDGKDTLVFSRSVGGDGRRHDHVGVILNLANANIENLKLKLLLTRRDVATLLNDLCEGEAVGNRFLARDEVDVLIEMQEALCLLDAIVLDEVDGRALVVDDNGMRQVKIAVDDRAIKERGDIIRVGVLGIDLGRVDCEIAGAASRIYAL